MPAFRFAVALLFASAASPLLADGLNPRLTGNLQFDWIDADEADRRGASNHQDWRRQEIAWTMTLPGDGAFKLEYDFEGEAFTDAYLRFATPLARLTVGQFKTPYGSEVMISSRSLLFTENSVSGVFGIGRRLGVMLDRSQAKGGWAVALFGGDISGAGADLGIAARGWRAFGDADSGLWHLGLAAAAENPKNTGYRSRLRPELRSPDTAWLDSGSYTGVDRLQRSALEGAYQKGNLLLQGEWLRLGIDADDSEHLRGGYLQAGWTVFGSPRVYKDGLFGTPKAVSGLGQVELAARYSRLSLPRAGAGEVAQQGWSLGLNAQFGPFLRFMLDRHDSERRGPAADAELWTLRAAFMF